MPASARSVECFKVGRAPREHLRTVRHFERTLSPEIVGWNSERFDVSNLALRACRALLHLLRRYRVGCDARKVAGQPEITMNVEDW